MTRREIELLRSEIERIDSEILHLVARREEIASEIGLAKQRDHIPIRDRERERQVKGTFAKRARTMGIDPVFAEILAELLISDSVKVQKMPREQDLQSKKVLVVGGSGRMGEWFCRILANRGADVKIWDPRGRLEGYTNLKSLRDSAREADTVIVASPPGVVDDDLGRVVSSSPKGVVFDICSVKSHISNRLRRAAARGLKVTSAHPMFGPSAPTPRGRNILVCDCGSEDANKSVISLFERAGARVSRISIEKHDELMAYVLGLAHLCTIVFSHTLVKSRTKAKDLTNIRGPSFDKMARMARDLSKESVRVYHDIQSLNPHTRRVIASMQDALAELGNAALDRNPAKFRKIVNSSRRYLEVG